MGLHAWAEIGQKIGTEIRKERINKGGSFNTEIQYT